MSSVPNKNAAPGGRRRLASLPVEVLARPPTSTAANLGLDLESCFFLLHGPAPRLLVIAPVKLIEPNYRAQFKSKLCRFDNYLTID
jgi:hypothetical protein